MLCLLCEVSWQKMLDGSVVRDKKGKRKSAFLGHYIDIIPDNNQRMLRGVQSKGGANNNSNNNNNNNNSSSKKRTGPWRIWTIASTFPTDCLRSLAGRGGPFSWSGGQRSRFQVNNGPEKPRNSAIVGAGGNIYR